MHLAMLVISSREGCKERANLLEKIACVVEIKQEANITAKSESIL